MKKGNLYVISGPSGSGKSTVCQIVQQKLNIKLSISATTRKPRDGEINGVHYYFLSLDEFEEKIANNEFLEYANVHGNYYGTLRSEVERIIDNGEDVILEIDVQGGTQIKNKFPLSHTIFFRPPNIQELEKRLRGRKSDSEDAIQLRLKNAIKELEYEKKYDYVIINDTIEKACFDFEAIIIKNR